MTKKKVTQVEGAPPVELADGNGTPSSIEGAANAPAKAPKAPKQVKATEADIALMPRPPFSASVGAVIYRWPKEKLWRAEAEGIHFILRTLRGMEGWIPVEGPHAKAGPGEIWTVEQLKETGLAEPPGGSYGDVYQNPGEPFLRAATLTGNFMSVSPQIGWIVTNAGGVLLTTPVYPSNAPYPDPNEWPPDDQVSVQVRRTREARRREQAEERARVAVAEAEAAKAQEPSA